MSFRSDISKTLKLLGDERRNYSIGLSSLFVLNVADVLAPLFMAVAVDLTEAALNETAAQTPPILAALGVSAASFTIVSAIAVFLVLRVIANVLRYPMLMFTAVPSWRIAQTLRNRLVGKLLDLSPAFYDRAKSGDLMSIATADLLAVRMMLGPAVLVGADTFSLISLVLLVLFALSWKLTLIVLIPLPIIAFITSRLSKAEYSRFRAVQEDIAKLTERARESYAGVRVLKGFARESFDQARFEGFSEHHYDLNLSLAKVRSVFEPTLFLMVGISTSLVLIFGGMQVVNGTLSVGTFLAFIFLVNYLSWPMVGFGWTVSLIQRGRASLTRLENLDAEPIEVFDRPNASPAKSKADIELRNLTFTYPVPPDQGGDDDGDAATASSGDNPTNTKASGEPTDNVGAAEGAVLEPVLRDVSLRIPAGTTLGVVGPVGSGKSTLAKMLVRLYEPPDGTVFVGDDDVRDLTLSSLRERIVIAPQDTFLFSDTVGNNVILASDDDDDPTKYTRLSEVHEEIDGLKKGYGTLLGERGVNLSGGQRQRVAIARAIAADPELLVLDDCLSAIDANTEDAILAHLREIFEGRSGVIISHRVRAVQACDQIAVLEDGRVSELGTHEELLRSGGYYARMAEEQMDTEGAHNPTEPSLAATGATGDAASANTAAASNTEADA